MTPPADRGCRLPLAAGLVLLAAGGLARADSAPADGIGRKVEHVRFATVAGKPMTLDDLKAKKAVVVVFLSFECPISASYAQPLAALARDSEARGVSFLGVAADEEDPAEVARRGGELGVPFPIVADPDRAVAAAFHARVTPEAFVLDAGHVMRYRGRIDDAYAERLSRSRPVTRLDLAKAIEEVVAGKPVSEPATRAVGCAIASRRADRQGSGPVTFSRDVLPILQNHCQSCHRPGEVGPFSLLTCKQAVHWAEDIKTYTQSRKMPPWKPVDGPAFHNERRLSDEEIATLAAWVEGGAPAGDPAEAPPPRQFVEGWQLGKPDLVLSADGDFRVGPTGQDVFRCFVLPTNLPEDVYVTAVEVRPGARKVVHHALLFIDTSGQARRLEKAEKEKAGGEERPDGGPGYTSAMGIGFLPRAGMGGWAPGQMARSLPEGSGYLLPRGGDVVLQVHYHRDGRAEKDRTSVGLYLAKKPVSRAFQGLVIGGRFLAVPAGDAHYRVRGSIWVRQDCDLHTVMPHMHMLGREVKVTMQPPGGPARTLVAIKDWDYNWQETYQFRAPVHVPAGTRFDIEAVYDNTEQNPNNPNRPPRMVFFGQQTTDEMCFGFLGATSDQPGRIRFDRKGPEAKAESARKTS